MTAKPKRIKLSKNAPSNKFNFLVGVFVIALVAILGIHFFGSGRASAPYGSAEAEVGQLAGVAALKSDANASSGQYVQFGPPPNTGGGGNAYCGFNSNTPAISKVMIIWEENESDSSIINISGLPFMNLLTNDCGFATDYWAYTHPSLPNYMAATSGVDYSGSPWNNDCSPSDSGCNTSNPSIFSQMGSNWTSFNESMPSSCYMSDSGEYAVRHNPAVYYTNISSSTCNAQDVPLGSTTSGNLLNAVKNGLPDLTTVTPNLLDDWHDGTASQADNWLKGWINIITAGSDYQSGKLAIVVLFDEGNGSGNQSSNTYATWLSAYTKPGVKSSTFFDDYSITKTVEDLLGQNELGKAQTDTSMAPAFNL